MIESGITHIVNCAGNVYPNYFPTHFHYLILCLSDDAQENRLSLFPFGVAAIEDIRKSCGSIFVHCHQGVSRFAFVLLALIFVCLSI